MKCKRPKYKSQKKRGKKKSKRGKTRRNKKDRGHLGLLACVCLCFGVATQNAKLRAVSQTPREGTHTYFSPALILSLAFRSLLRLIFHWALTAGGPHLMLTEQQ